MEKLIIYGAGQIAQLAKYYFENDSEFEVVAFTVDKEYQDKDTFEDIPLVAFEDLKDQFPPTDYKMHVAAGYANLNRGREAAFHKAKDNGYKLASYVSSKCNYLSQFPPGENAFILEDNTIQPFVKIEENVMIWSGNHIGHHSTIKAHNYISSHVVISGQCVVDSYCFLGVNASIGHKVTIGKGTLLGAGVSVSKDTDEFGVYVPARSAKLEKPSTAFNV